MREALLRICNSSNIIYPCIPFEATIFPQNLAAARLYYYFKALFDTVTIRGWLDFEDSVYRDQHACAYTASIMSLLE